MFPLVWVAPLMENSSKLKLLCEKFCNKSAVFRQQSALLTFWNRRKHPHVLSLVNHLSCIKAACNGKADSVLLLMLYLQRSLFAYYMWPIKKTENVYWKHGRKMAPLWVSLLELCYTEKILNFRSAVFRESPRVINSYLYFLLPGYSIRIFHSTDFILTVETGSFFALFWGGRLGRHKFST